MTKVKALELASLAQQVEHAAVNRRVVGSNPTGGARKRYCRHLNGDGNVSLETRTVSSVGRAAGS